MKQAPLRLTQERKAFLRRILPVAVMIAAVAACEWLFFQTHESVAAKYDSVAYIAQDTLQFLMTGRPNNGYCPGLGAVLDLAEWIAGERYLELVVAFQTVASVASTALLWSILRMLGVGQPLSLLVCFLYGTAPAVMGWNNWILTESLSLTGTICFFYCIVRYIKQDSVKCGVASVVITLFLTFLRTQFMVYFALLAVFYVWKWFYSNPAQRRGILQQVAVMVVSLLLIFAYSGKMKEHYGVFAVSDALPRQELWVCVEGGYYKSFRDPAMIASIDERLSSIEHAVGDTVACFGNEKVLEECKYAILQNLPRYLVDRAYVIFVDSWRQTLLGYGYYERLENAPNLLVRCSDLQLGLFDCLQVGHMLVASLLEGLAMVYVWIRQKQPPWVHMALFSIAMCTTWVVFFVTYAEYARTMVSILPYFFIMLALFLQWITHPEASVRAQAAAVPGTPER